MDCRLTGLRNGWPTGVLDYRTNGRAKRRQTYYNAIIDAIIETGSADQLIIVISYLIHSLTIDTLHIVGDIFDRGSGASKILDVLSTVRDYDIQWGNHDIEWMGAMAGNMALLATVLRVSIRYANIETLEEGYGINLLPLANFASILSTAFTNSAIRKQIITIAGIARIPYISKFSIS